MTPEQTIEMARSVGFPSAVLLDMYDNKRAALCDSEIRELESIKRFAQLVRNAVLWEVNREVSGSPLLSNVAALEVQAILRKMKS